MERLTWTVTADNKDISSLSNVSLPNYVANASIGDTLTGIPYCWGGFNGIATISSRDFDTRYADVCKRDVAAGNMTTVGGHKSGTAGLDCSRFVLSAYGYATKVSTTNLAGYGRAITFDELQHMDFLVAAGDHAMLFSGIEEVDGVEMYRIYDSSTDVQKVAQRLIKKEYINRFEPRTVWSD